MLGVISISIYDLFEAFFIHHRQISIVSTVLNEGKYNQIQLIRSDVVDIFNIVTSVFAKVAQSHTGNAIVQFENCIVENINCQTCFNLTFKLFLLVCPSS